MPLVDLVVYVLRVHFCLQSLGSETEVTRQHGKHFPRGVIMWTCWPRVVTRIDVSVQMVKGSIVYVSDGLFVFHSSIGRFDVCSMPEDIIDHPVDFVHPRK